MCHPSMLLWESIETLSVKVLFLIGCRCFQDTNPSWLWSSPLMAVEDTSNQVSGFQGHRELYQLTLRARVYTYYVRRLCG